jgi:uncharacterized protein (TIGR02996 family)
MDEMLSFLRAIAEDPRDEAVRLVFSDWLEEQGHTERAEFIRLQIALARLDPTDESYPGLTARMYRLGIFTTPGQIPGFDHLPDKQLKVGFRRGFLEDVDTRHAQSIDTTGFDLLPLQSLRTHNPLIDAFKRFANLRWLEYHSDSPTKYLEVLGPDGWFKHLEELSLPQLGRTALEAGVIPQLDLPRLRSLYIVTDSFADLTDTVPAPEEEGSEEDDYYDSRPIPTGLASFLPANVVPSVQCPLERFTWNTSEDSDSYPRDDHWTEFAPTLESLLEHFKHHKLKDIELAVDWDDHEGGNEGVKAGTCRQNPLDLSPTLQGVTLTAYDLQLLQGSSRKLKSLRIYSDYGDEDGPLETLSDPVCSELESLRLPYLGQRADAASIDRKLSLSKLRHLNLSGGFLASFTQCEFPHLVSIQCSWASFVHLTRCKWPKLQSLSIRVVYVRDSEIVDTLRTFAQFDGCPNLTRLSIAGYFDSTQLDFSFLAKCPHMPHLSLVQFPHYQGDRNYIVKDGNLLPVRSDLLMEEMLPSMPFRFANDP